MSTVSPSTRHAVVGSPLGPLTIVRDDDGITGVYFPHHWTRPDPATFGPAQIDRFHAYLGEQRTMIAQGPWFGDDAHIVRIGLAYEPADRLELGLEVISAALGATAAASIPLTHRTLARSVAFATGHDADGHLPPDLDVRADVLVFFMPLRQAGAIAAHLIAAGRAHDEAIALVSDATTARQQVRMATLATAAEAASRVPAGAPALLIVGPVLARR